MISSRLGCRQSRVAIRDFSGYQQVRIKGEKDTKRSMKKLQLRDTRCVGGDSGLQVKRAG